MEIVRLLVNYINMNPDQRFGQILQNLEIVEDDGDYGEKGLIDNFYEESEQILARVRQYMKAGLIDE